MPETDLVDYDASLANLLLRGFGDVDPGVDAADVAARAIAKPRLAWSRVHGLGAAVSAGFVLLAALVASGGAPNGGDTRSPASLPMVTDDARYPMCALPDAPVIAAFPLKAAHDFSEVFPRSGYFPLADTGAPAFVVVFEEGWRELPKLPGLVVSSPATSPAGGLHVVCIVIGGEPYYVTDMDIDGMQLPTSSHDPGTTAMASVSPPPGAGRASWALPSDEEIGPETTSYTALVTERACASGRSSEGRIVGPQIAYTAEAVIVTFQVQGLDGGQDCQSNPSTPVLVTLDEPLGDRLLLDGDSHPPREPPRCEAGGYCE